MERIIKVCILEDEEVIRESLAAYLDDLGLTVCTAETAEDALEVIRLQEIDIAVVDLRLPGTGGDVFIEKAHELKQNMKFIIYTGSPPDEIPEYIMSMPCVSSNIFYKPVYELRYIYEEIIRIAPTG